MTAAHAPSPLPADGPPDPELVRIRDLVYQVGGIFHPDTKLGLLSDCCSRRMKERKTQTLHEYFECLTIKPDRQTELVALLNEITIGETCFFRSQPQLDALRQVVIPKVLEAKAKLRLRRLRIWSAGCSTGEEPYTLSMVLLEEAQRRLKDWTIEILATDLNQRSLAHAKAALYGTYSTRNLTPYFRQKYFTLRQISCKCRSSYARTSRSAVGRFAHDLHEGPGRRVLLQSAHLFRSQLKTARHSALL